MKGWGLTGLSATCGVNMTVDRLLWALKLEILSEFPWIAGRVGRPLPGLTVIFDDYFFLTHPNFLSSQTISPIILLHLQEFFVSLLEGTPHPTQDSHCCSSSNAQLCRAGLAEEAGVQLVPGAGAFGILCHIPSVYREVPAAMVGIRWFF